MYFVMFSSAAAIILYFLPLKGRRPLLLFIIAVMVALALYDLTGAPLGSASIFPLLEELGLAPIVFMEHAYSRLAGFGFILVGAIALLYGLDVSGAAEQAAAVLAIAAAVGIVFAGNFITLFMFWELLTLATALLVFLKGAPYSRKTGYKFLIFHLSGGLALLLGIAEHYEATGSFALAVPEAGLIYFIVAVGFKAAFLPFHLWVNWGYPNASFPASVVLVGLTTKIGVYALARFIPAHFGIMMMGAVMACFGVTCALLQKDLRRLLSYHIISQVGYMVAAVGAGTYAALDGGLLHMVNHMLYKALLFMSVGALIYTTGTENIHELNHHTGAEKEAPLWRVLPLAAVGALIGALAISGTPLFNGYVSKYLLKKAMHGAGAAEYMLLAAGVGTSLSFCKFVYFGFIKPRVRLKRALPLSMQGAILTAALLCVVIGIYPGIMASLLPYGSSLHVYSFHGITAALQYILAGAVIFFFMRKILEQGISLPGWLSIEVLLFPPLTWLLKKIISYSGIFAAKTDQAYTFSGRSMLKMAEKAAKFNGSLDDLYSKSALYARKLVDSTKSFEERIEIFYDKSEEKLHKLTDKTLHLDESLNTMCEKSGDALKKMAQRTGHFDGKPDDKTEQPAGSRKYFWEKLKFRPGDFNIKNLNFDTFLLALMLGIFLLILLYYATVY